MIDEKSAEAIANVIRASVAVQEAMSHFDVRLNELLGAQAQAEEVCVHTNTKVVPEGAHMIRQCLDCGEELKLRAG